MSEVWWIWRGKHCTFETVPATKNLSLPSFFLPSALNTFKNFNVKNSLSAFILIESSFVKGSLMFLILVGTKWLTLNPLKQHGAPPFLFLFYWSIFWLSIEIRRNNTGLTLSWFQWEMLTMLTSCVKLAAKLTILFFTVWRKITNMTTLWFSV